MLEARVQKLERQNKWFKRAGLAVLLVAALTGAAQREMTQIHRALAAETLFIVDKEGRTRWSLTGDGLLYVDANGKTRIGLVTNKEQTFMHLLDADGKVRASLSESGLALSDDHRKPRITLRNDKERTCIALQDANGKVVFRQDGRP